MLCAALKGWYCGLIKSVKPPKLKRCDAILEKDHLIGRARRYAKKWYLPSKLEKITLRKRIAQLLYDIRLS